MATTEELKDVGKRFLFQGAIKSIIPYGDGHINDTYKVTCVDSTNATHNYILQRINHNIFNRVDKLMQNIVMVTNFLNQNFDTNTCCTYEVLTLVKTIEGDNYCLLSDGSYWRSYIFVKKAISYSYTDDTTIIYNAARAFGAFQAALRDFPAGELWPVIPDFHNTYKRYCNFKVAVAKDRYQRKQFCQDSIDFVHKKEYLASMFSKHIENGTLPLRVTHNDTKINNVLIDAQSKVARCVIDLDTVMSGSLLFDYGDAIRTISSTEREDSQNLDTLKVDLDKFKAFTKGYLDAVGNFLSPIERELLPYAGIIMTYECGMRFLTDYLEGDHYFKTTFLKHNLIRAQNQFKLVEALENTLDVIEEIINNALTKNKEDLQL